MSKAAAPTEPTEVPKSPRCPFIASAIGTVHEDRMMSHAVSAPIPIPTAEKRQWHDTFDLHNALPPYRKPLAPPAKKNTSASRSSSLLTTQARELANQWRTSMRDDFASPQNVAALRPQVGSRQQLAVQRAHHAPMGI